MKIKGLSGQPIGTVDTGKAQSADKPQTGGATGGGKTSASQGDDTLSLTLSASRLQELQEQIASLPVTDENHIADIQRSLASGNFSFEPVDAAESLLTQEREFARSKAKE